MLGLGMCGEHAGASASMRHVAHSGRGPLPQSDLRCPLYVDSGGSRLTPSRQNAFMGAVPQPRAPMAGSARGLRRAHAQERPRKLRVLTTAGYPAALIFLAQSAWPWEAVAFAKRRGLKRGMTWAPGRWSPRRTSSFGAAAPRPRLSRWSGILASPQAGGLPRAAPALRAGLCNRVLGKARARHLWRGSACGARCRRRGRRFCFSTGSWGERRETCFDDTPTAAAARIDSWWARHLQLVIASRHRPPLAMCGGLGGSTAPSPRISRPAEARAATTPP